VSTTAAAAAAPRTQRELFRVKFGKVPEPWAIDLNKELSNFPQNEEGAFVNAEGTIVDVFGNPIKLDGGSRKSKKRSRFSKTTSLRRRRPIIK